MDASTKSILNSHGFGHLYEKYANAASRMDKGIEAIERHENYNPKGRREEAVSSRADDLRICHVCDGQGIKRVEYNYQIRTINCENCDGEGILWKCENGTLLHLSRRPVRLEKSDGECPPPLF